MAGTHHHFHTTVNHIHLMQNKVVFLILHNRMANRPKTLPIIGNLHQLGAEVQHVALSKLAKLHGGVMTIWIGSWRPVIVVSNIAEAWEVLVNKSSDYAARRAPVVTKLSTAGWRTVSTSDPGPYWHNLRKGLQNGPLGPINVSAQMHFQERDIQDMINDMQEETKTNGGIVKPLDHATVRLLSRLIFGQTFDDKLFIESMHHEIDELIRMSGYFRLSEAFSYAKYLPSHRRAVKQLRQINLAIKELVQPFLASSPPSNRYLKFLLSQDYPHDVVVACISELYVLGVDSTSATTTWALAFLIHDQTAQENLYQNIKQNTVNGDSTILKTEDLSKMHYLQAVMKETLRMKPIAPFAIPHKTSKDTTLMGRKVAKGTRVMVSIYALHHNPDVWTEPYKFMPERFLQGDTNVMDPSFLPFSAGMRTCAGMELGKLQFSLALSNLINFFKWTNAVEGELPDMSEELSLVTHENPAGSTDYSPYIILELLGTYVNFLHACPDSLHSYFVWVTVFVKIASA